MLILPISFYVLNVTIRKFGFIGVVHVMFHLGSAVETKGDRDGDCELEICNPSVAMRKGEQTRMVGASVLAVLQASWSPDGMADV